MKPDWLSDGRLIPDEAEMEASLKGIVLETRPEDFGFDTTLWTCDLLAELTSRHYNVEVIGNTINHHLHQLGLTNQKPHYLPLEQDPAAVERYLNE